MVIAIGIDTEHWEALRIEFPEILNCCINVVKAFKRERDDSTAGSGFDQPTRDRMKAKETWDAVMGASVAVLHAFGILIAVCNHGRHRSLALAYEVAMSQDAELVSIRCPTQCRKLRQVREFMEVVSPRLSQHALRFRDVPHPVTGFSVCSHGFDGTGWGNSNDRGSVYLDLRVGNILVDVRRDREEAHGWLFGILTDGDTGGVLGWYPPTAVSPMASWHFRNIGNLCDFLVMKRLP